LIRVVVFDFDGTLVDSNGIKQCCFGEVVAHMPGGPDALIAARRSGGDRYRIFARIARMLQPGDDAATRALASKLAADYTQRCLRKIAVAPERRGARDALRALRLRGMRLWISSATPLRDLHDVLRARKMLALVDGALGAPRTKLQNLRAILACEGAMPREAVVVGDGLDDQAAARRAGAWFVAVTAEQPFRGHTGLAMPDLVRLPAGIHRFASGRDRRS
jgi:beta-phosphoglucomutase-like phosphatase (HAD superfamily)